mgnify:CR=1 FL=1
MSRRAGTAAAGGRTKETGDASQITVRGDAARPSLVTRSEEVVCVVRREDLVLDPGLQMRADNHSQGYIAELAEVCRAGKPLPPVVVFRDPESGAMRLVDGHARVEAHQRAEMSDVLAVVHDGGRRDAFEHALGVNATHGARRTRADLRKAVEAALADPAMVKWSSIRIADVCRCSDRYVDGVRRELAGPERSDLPEVRVGKDGKSYPAKKRRGGGPNGSAPMGEATGENSHAHRATDRGTNPIAEVGAKASAAVAQPQAEATTTVRERDVPTPSRAVAQVKSSEVVPAEGSTDDTVAVEVARKTGEDIRWSERRVREVGARLSRAVTRLKKADASVVRGLLRERRELGVLRALRDNLNTLLAVVDPLGEPTASQGNAQEAVS